MSEPREFCTECELSLPRGGVGICQDCKDFREKFEKAWEQYREHREHQQAKTALRRIGGLMSNAADSDVLAGAVFEILKEEEVL